MVALTRRSVALLAIAASATAALAAEGPAEENVQLVAESPDGQQPAQTTPLQTRISPAAAGGAAVGVALLLAVVYFGFQVLGAKIVQTDANTAGKKVAEEVLYCTDKFTLSTPGYSAFLTLTFEGKSAEVVKGLKDEEKQTKLEVLSGQLQEFLNSLQKDGTYPVELFFGDEKVTVSVDIRFTEETTTSTAAPAAPAAPAVPAETS
ncbi:uncharacterized protein EMH_0004040 [Eimeria mitis]|uniref:Uncharacterized protein n=1 Tax=Eimeria mitis TaxID=44415 RepID=U6KD94_9EIME|nr:uncharacterized protein EMH_0004040 [Eimeria mitis]CDJ35985.1 hypothetical protein, conserved [Eimeria mitis]